MNGLGFYAQKAGWLDRESEMVIAWIRAFFFFRIPALKRVFRWGYNFFGPLFFGLQLLT